MNSVSTSPVEVVESEQDLKLIARRKRYAAQRTALTFWTFVGPLVLGLIVFFYIPIIWGFVLSFSEARATVTPTRFVGLQNYVSMLSDPDFIHALIVFTIFAILIVPATFACALGLALLVSSIKVAQGFFRSVFFLPTACSYVLASIVWKMSIFNGTYYGLANSLLHVFGKDAVSWISSPTPPLYWLVLVSVRLWLQLGIYMIIFIAGLQDIPRELYEASYVDGARKGWQTFWAITFPLLRNTSVSILLLNIIAAFQAFDEFYNIMTGGNQILARPPLVYLFNVALTNQDYGLGSAGGIILTLIIIVFSLIQGRVLGFGKRD
jgi:multiple sugar transport system permease protein